MWVSDTSIKQPVFVTMLMLALLVVGILAYFTIPVDLLPDVSIPVVSVTTVYPGASPDEIETRVTKVLEESLGSLNGVDTIQSTSAEGISQVVIRFQLEHSASEGVRDVQERLAAIRNRLPQDIQDPVIQRFDLSALPIMSFAIAPKNREFAPGELRNRVEDDIKPLFERIDGVAAVNVSGGRQREIHVNLNLAALRARHVSPQQVVGAIQAQNLNVPAGHITQNGQDLLIRTPGEFHSLDDLRNTVVGGGQAPIFLRDVATVEDSFKDVDTYSRLNGQDSVVLSIQKQSGTNTMQVADAVKEEISRIEKDHPDLQVVIARDESEFVRDSTNDALFDLLLGGIGAMLVVLLFFRDLRNTLVTVAGLPVIMIGTFGVMKAVGLTFNMLTLLALSLSVGLVIDDAIVVRENIFRHMEMGKHPKEASREGTGEVALSVMAMTFTIVSVFLPVAFTTGITGRFFRSFGLTVAFAVLISLIEAFTFAPMLSAYFFKQQEAKTEEEQMGRMYRMIDRYYRAFLSWTLRHKIITVIIAMAFFALSLATLPFLKLAFLADIGQNSVELGVKLPPGTTLQQTDQTARRVEAVLAQRPDVVDVLTSVGTRGSPEQASFFVKLKKGITGKEVEQELRSNLVGVPGLAFGSGGMEGGSPTSVTGRAIQIKLLTTGDFHNLDVASQQVMDAIRDVPGLVDLARSYEPGKPEMQIVVDRQRAADFGLTTAQIGSTVRMLINGQKASRYRLDGDEADILVRLRPEDRQNTAGLLSLYVSTPRGTPIPLGSVARLEQASGPTQILRENQQREIIVGANTLGRTQNEVVQDIRKRLQRASLPPGVAVSYGGQTQRMQESYRSLLTAMLLAVIFVYMVLASQFGSFTQPFVIMLALPLSFVGAFLALFLTDKPLDMMAMIGMIMLMGLVTKNSIMLVDFTNQARRRGLSRDEALLEAGPLRLRPIIMTTLALIVGMFPVALGVGAGGGFRATMAIAVIGGLITSTLLTLLLVPAAYALLDDVINFLRSPRRALQQRFRRAPAHTEAG
jgi:HAE1 family hydrophobic/amphiphilic exporter-1